MLRRYKVLGTRNKVRDSSNQDPVASIKNGLVFAKNVSSPDTKPLKNTFYVHNNIYETHTNCSSAAYGIDFL